MNKFPHFFINLVVASAMKLKFSTARLQAFQQKKFKSALFLAFSVKEIKSLPIPPLRKIQKDLFSLSNQADNFFF